MNMQLLLAVWGAILAGYVMVLVMRHQLGKREDDHLHVADGEQQLISAQNEIAHKLDVLDRWKTALLVLFILFGLFVAAVQVWRVWQAQSSQAIFS